MAAESILLIPDYPLTVLPNLAVQIGLSEVIFLQQVRYWTIRSLEEQHALLSTTSGEESVFVQEFRRRHGIEGRASP